MPTEGMVLPIAKMSFNTVNLVKMVPTDKLPISQVIPGPAKMIVSANHHTTLEYNLVISPCTG